MVQSIKANCIDSTIDATIVFANEIKKVSRCKVKILESAEPFSSKKTPSNPKNSSLLNLMKEIMPWSWVYVNYLLLFRL